MDAAPPSRNNPVSRLSRRAPPTSIIYISSMARGRPEWHPVGLMLIAAAALAGLLASNARADIGDWDWLTQYQKPNMHYGRLALKPYYKLSELYDSNIYLVPRDQRGSGQVGGGVRSSWITGNDLGLETELPWTRLSSMSLGYDFDSLLYATQPDANNTIDQAAHADYTHAGAHGLTYKAGDKYVNTTDQALSELIQRQRRWMNLAYASIDYAPVNGRLAGGVDADHETDKYLDPALGRLLNRYQEDAGFNIGYMVAPKTKAYVSYHRQIIHYTVNPAAGQSDSDNKSHSAAAGLSGELTAKIKGRVEAGMMYREYDAALFPGSSRAVRAPTVSTELTYQYDKDTKAVLNLTRLLEVSIDPSNPFYYSNSASFSFDRKFPRKVSAGIDLGVGKNQYLNSSAAVNADGGVTTGYRRDDFYQGGVRVEYDIQQWLSTGLAYVARTRNSTFTGQFNYADQVTTWNVKLQF